MIRSLGLMLLVVLSLLVTPSTLAGEANGFSKANEMECITVYVVDAILITKSLINETITFVAPINVSLKGVEQRVEVLSIIGMNRSGDIIGFNISVGGRHLGIAIYKVRVCYRPMAGILTELLNNPRAYRGYEIPENISEGYVKEPYPLVVKIVKKDFERWLKSNGLNVEELSKAGLAVYAAKFVYLHYIKYSLGALPRTLDEVIKERKGDCDDMSRVLVNLLWSYGIPAAIVYGDVVTPMIKPFEIEVENVTYVIIDEGPHAFVMAYLPPFGWVSLDFLAFSYIQLPFTIYGISTKGVVTKEEVEETRSVLKKLEGLVLRMCITSEEVKDLVAVMGEKQAVEAIAESAILSYARKLGIEVPKLEKIGFGKLVTVTKSFTTTLTREYTKTNTVTVVKTETRTYTTSLTRTVTKLETLIKPKTVTKVYTSTRVVEKTSTVVETVTQLSTTTTTIEKTYTKMRPVTVERTAIYTTTYTTTVTKTDILEALIIVLPLIVGIAIVFWILRSK